jgi:hypothetical protein
MIKNLDNIMSKCTNPNNKEGITFIEVVIIGIVFPFMTNKILKVLKFALVTK